MSKTRAQSQAETQQQGRDNRASKSRGRIIPLYPETTTRRVPRAIRVGVGFTLVNPAPTINPTLISAQYGNNSSNEHRRRKAGRRTANNGRSKSDQRL